MLVGGQSRRTRGKDEVLPNWARKRTLYPGIPILLDWTEGGLAKGTAIGRRCGNRDFELSASARLGMGGTTSRLKACGRPAKGQSAVSYIGKMSRNNGPESRDTRRPTPFRSDAAE